LPPPRLAHGARQAANARQHTSTVLTILYGGGDGDFAYGAHAARKRRRRERRSGGTDRKRNLYGVFYDSSDDERKGGGGKGGSRRSRHHDRRSNQLAGLAFGKAGAEGGKRDDDEGDGDAVAEGGPGEEKVEDESLPGWLKEKRSASRAKPDEGAKRGEGRSA